MAGKLYGVGVGPGDPELLTLKALRLVKEAEVIALPGQVPEDTVAFKIVEGAYPELGKKELLAVPFPMSKDPKVLKSYHDAGAQKVKEVLDQGKNVVFLTLGDPTVYSTYLYVHHRLVAQGYETEIVCGITSFCAVSARLNTGRSVLPVPGGPTRSAPLGSLAPMVVYFPGFSRKSTTS